MNKIFWGLLFLFINISINGVSLTPAFVGYILIYLGMKEHNQIEAFDKARPWAIAGVILSAITWLPIVQLGIIGVIIGTGIQLMVTYLIAQGVILLEMLYGTDLNSAKLSKAWKVMAIGVILSLVLSWMLSELAFIALVVGLIAAIVYIVAFYRSKENMPTA